MARLLRDITQFLRATKREHRPPAFTPQPHIIITLLGGAQLRLPME